MDQASRLQAGFSSSKNICCRRKARQKKASPQSCLAVARAEGDVEAVQTRGPAEEQGWLLQRTRHLEDANLQSVAERRASSSSAASLTGYSEKTFAGLPASRASKKAGEGAAPGLLEIVVLWAFFVLNRAGHPFVIDLSKESDGKLHYDKLSPVIAKSFMVVAGCNLVACFDREGWKAGLLKCYSGPSFYVFSWLGVHFAVGDFLEMLSMSSMDGATYQVLLQSKLVITALLMRIIKGQVAHQTAPQWSVLVTLSLGMCLFMLTQDRGPSQANGTGTAGILGFSFVLCKVLLSCYSAVHADKSLKHFKNMPTHVQLCQLTASWGVVSMLLAGALDPNMVCSPEAFFHGWTAATVLVCLSFVAKTVLTMTILKVFDSVLKSIGEAVAVLVIYLAQVLLPHMPAQFEVNTFLAFLVVVMAVTTYILLKNDLARASTRTSGIHDAADPKGNV